MFARSPLCPSVFIIICALLLASSSHGHGLDNRHNQNSPSSSPFAAVEYHGGPLLTATNGINVYLIWYGGFSLEDRTSITDFFASFNLASPRAPAVETWWKTMASYKDKTGHPVSGTVGLSNQVGDAYSLGKNLKRVQIGNLVKNKIIKKELPMDPNGIYLVLTSTDVTIEEFCMGSCGFHNNFAMSSKDKVVYAHVGDSSVQCPGLCAWPYAVPAYGPPGQALVAPNGAGADGMIMNIATIIAGAASNPYNTGYFQGNALAPLEAVTACPGVFGAGAYPGYSGKLMVDKFSKASYNVNGANGKKFLLPAIWDLSSRACKVA